MDLELLGGDTDLGDGLQALALPGHTPGSTGVTFNCDSETVVLAGDAVKTVSELVVGQQGEVGQKFPIGDTLENDRASIQRVKSIADRIVPGHFAEIVKTPTGFVQGGPQEFDLIIR